MNTDRMPLCLNFSYLDDTLTHLLNCLKRERERPAAFQAIGLIAVSVQADINRDLARIMDVIRSSLPSKELPQKYVHQIVLVKFEIQMIELSKSNYQLLAHYGVTT